jgi:hypothetical protein
MNPWLHQSAMWIAVVVTGALKYGHFRFARLYEAANITASSITALGDWRLRVFSIT